MKQRSKITEEDRHKKFCGSIGDILSKFQTELNENPERLIKVPMEDFIKRMSSNIRYKPHPFIVLEIKRCLLNTDIDVDIGSLILSKRLDTEQYKKKLAEQKIMHEKYLSLYSHGYQ